MYRIIGYTTVTTPATTPSTVLEIIITWTDADDSGSISFDLTPEDSSNVTTAIQSGFLVCNCKSGSAISFSTSGYASTEVMAMQYGVHTRVEEPI